MEFGVTCPYKDTNINSEEQIQKHQLADICFDVYYRTLFN